MTRVFAVVLMVCSGLAILGLSRADMPPPYEPYGIGARLDEGDPFPKLADVRAGSPAQKAGLKSGDGVIAIDGDYSKSGRVPFYYYARGMQGRKDSVIELVVLQDQQRVVTVKLRRGVKVRSNW